VLNLISPCVKGCWKYSKRLMGTSSCSSIPELKIDSFAFANVNNTIRLRDGRLLVRLSDLLEGAPEACVAGDCAYSAGKMYGGRLIVRRRRAIENTSRVMRSCANTPGPADARPKAAPFGTRVLL